MVVFRPEFERRVAAQWCAIGARVRLCGGGLGARLRSMSIQLGSNVRVWMAVPSGGLIPMLSNAAKAIAGRARCGDCIRPKSATGFGNKWVPH